jgi:hypothetical protein
LVIDASTFPQASDPKALPEREPFFNKTAAQERFSYLFEVARGLWLNLGTAGP